MFFFLCFEHVLFCCVQNMTAMNAGLNYGNRIATVMVYVRI
jgi:hypothetical protein